MLQLTYELRPKWKNNKNNKNKTQNAVSRSDPLQGSDKNDNHAPHDEDGDWRGGGCQQGGKLLTNLN